MRHKICKKVSHRTLEKAQRRCEYLNEHKIDIKSHKQNRTATPYKCEKCGMYHITYMKRSEHQRIVDETFLKQETKYWEKKYNVDSFKTTEKIKTKMDKQKSNKDLFLAEIENMSDQLLAEVQYFSCAIEENWEKIPKEIDILPFAFGYILSELCMDSLSKSMEQEVFTILNKIGYIKKSKTKEGNPLFVKGKDKYFEVSSWNEFMGLENPSY